MRRWTCFLATAFAVTAVGLAHAASVRPLSLQRTTCATAHIEDGDICSGGTKTSCLVDSSFSAKAIGAGAYVGAFPAPTCGDHLPCPPNTSPGNCPCYWNCRLCAADAGAWQTVRVDADSVVATGSVHAALALASSGNSPESRAWTDLVLRFAVESATGFAVDMSATLDGGGNDFHEYSLSMTLRDAATVLDSLDFKGWNTRPHRRQGTLPPGVYTVRIRASMQVVTDPYELNHGADFTCRHSLRLAFGVPLPPSPVAAIDWGIVKSLYQ